MSFKPSIEFQEPSVIKRFQEEKMRETLDYIASFSPFYKRLFEKCVFGWIDYNKKPEAFLAIIDNIDFKAIDERYFDTFVNENMLNFK